MAQAGNYQTSKFAHLAYEVIKNLANPRQLKVLVGQQHSSAALEISASAL